MRRLLLAAVGQEGTTYVNAAERSGMSVRVLDCFEEFHRRLQRMHGDLLLHAPGRKIDVADIVSREQFDMAIVHEDPNDFIRTALVTQSLRESGIRFIVVVTAIAQRSGMYRKCGAHRVIVAQDADEAWNNVQAGLPSFVSA